ncbi:MAG: hypothetical protein SGI97_01250 [candidate division Zixibacteria bacterium]|nr:hypothetical protein [candidate division Zixibacteria bacterium]
MYLHRTVLLSALTSVIWICASARVSAQDEGQPDSILFVITKPTANDASPRMIAELYFYTDSQYIVAATVGFKWIYENAVMTSADVSPQAKASFSFIHQVFASNSIDTTNLYDLFQFGGVRMSGDGLAPSPERQLIATFRWDLPGWKVNDVMFIDTSEFNAGTLIRFVASGNAIYVPTWEGKVVIRDINAPCCFERRGNVDCDGAHVTDISDLASLIDQLFVSNSPPCCPAESDLDGSGVIDITDVLTLIDYLFQTLKPPAACE